MTYSKKTLFLNNFRLLFKIPILELVLRKIVSGKNPDYFLSKLVPNNYQYKVGSIRRIQYHGVNLEVDIHDFVGHSFYFNFRDIGHEKLFEEVNDNDTIIDVGTNIGSTLLRFLDKVGPSGFVVGFEPDKENYQNALHNISINNFKNYKLFNTGLGELKGKKKFSIPIESNKGMNRIVEEESNSINTTEIEIDTLDEVMNNLEIKEINLIKIDVEGYELNVLKGANKSLIKYTPKLFIEIDEKNLINLGQHPKELIDYLEQLNYECFDSITKARINTEYDFTNCHFDIVCHPV